jgi:hypothetical protein
MSEPAGPPTLWAAMLADAAQPLDRRTTELLARDQQRWSRRYLHLPASVLSRLVVALICLVKRLLPFQFASHATMDRLCVAFLRRFVSADAVELLIRHFVVETNLLNAIVANSGVPGARPVTLRPTSLAELGGGAVIEHDRNVYQVLIALGGAPPRAPEALDLSMLDVPPIDAERDRRRLAHLDIETALCLMNIPFALCLTADEYRLAVNSLQLDERLLALLADLTGDLVYRTWRPAGFAVQLRTARNVPRDVHTHAVICEYAHERLLRRRDEACRPSPAGAHDRARRSASSR